MQLADDIFCSAFVREKMGQILTNQEKYIEQTSKQRKTMDNRPGAQDGYSCEEGQNVWPHGLIWGAISIPKMDCWQVWGGAFTPKSPFEVSKKQG